MIILLLVFYLLIMISSNGYMIPIAFSKKNKNVFLSCNNNDSKVNKKKDTDKINNSGDITINNDNSNSNSSNSININKKKKKISIKNNIQQKGYNANVCWRSISMADLRQHPLYHPLPLPENVNITSSLSLSKFRQDSIQWMLLHKGRLTTSKAAICLGLYETMSGNYYYYYHLIVIIIINTYT